MEVGAATAATFIRGEPKPRLLLKTTRKASRFPLQQMGCENRPEAIRPSLILHLLPSIVAPQPENKAAPPNCSTRTYRRAPTPPDRSGRNTGVLLIALCCLCLHMKGTRQSIRELEVTFMFVWAVSAQLEPGRTHRV